MMDQEAVTRVGFSLNAVWNTSIVRPTTSIQIINKIVITDFFLHNTIVILFSFFSAPEQNI